MSYEVHDKEVEENLIRIMQILRSIIPIELEFTLFMYHQSEEDQGLIYGSTMDRATNVHMLKAWIERNTQ